MHQNPYTKQAEAGVHFAERETKPVRGIVDKLVFGEDRKGADQKTHEKTKLLYQLMSQAQPEALRDTAVFVGRPEGKKVVNQIADTAHQDTLMQQLGGMRDFAAQALSHTPDTAWEQFPSSYFPVGDFVIAPEDSQGVTLHELGHAIDRNRPRFGGKFRRNMADKFKPTLLQELAAWKRGERALSEGAGSDEELEFAQEVLEDAYKVKRPALGTYFGGSLGGMVGGAAGLTGGLLLADHLDADRSQGRLFTLLGALLGSGIGGTAGIFGGAHLGRTIAGDDDKIKERAAKRIAKFRAQRDKRDMKKQKKQAKYLDFDRQGPKSIDAALNLLLQARAISEPSKQDLNKHSLSKRNMQSSLENLQNAKANQNGVIDAHSVLPSYFGAVGPAAIGAGVGAGAGLAKGFGGDNKGLSAGLGGALGMLIGGGLGAWDVSNKRKNTLNTLKLLREYGFNTPQKLRAAQALLGKL